VATSNEESLRELDEALGELHRDDPGHQALMKRVRSAHQYENDTTPIPCVVCDKPIPAIYRGARQPSGAVTFTSRGNYGSAVLDNIALAHVEINVCDPCLVTAAQRGQVREVLPLPRPQQQFRVKNWEPPEIESEDET